MNVIWIWEYDVIISLEFESSSLLLWSPSGIVVLSVLDCDIVVSEFELQLYNYTHFGINTLGKIINLFIIPTIG